MSVPVISVRQMREWEQASWATGRSETEVIGRVGLALARRALELTRVGNRILILAGKGHNGDDVRAAHGLLTDRLVDLIDVKDPKTDFKKLEELLSLGPDLIVDGLFGIGLTRPLDPGWIKLIQRVNTARLPVLAADVPSGLDAETGGTFGAAIEATVTLTVGAPKKGLIKSTAWPYVGRLDVATEVGLIPRPLAGELEWILPDDFTRFPPSRPVAGHKGDFGHLALIAGSLGYHGAAVLAASGAQRARPGLITVWTTVPAYAAVAAQLQAVMVHPWKRTVTLPDKISAVLIGPGLAAERLPENIRTTARRLWKNFPGPVVVDASALDWLPEGATLPKAIRVITPHPGEAARLLKTTPAQIQASRPEMLRKLSVRFGNCWVVLKGHQTLVGRSSDSISVNSSGNPYLAQGGSGDVLSGYLAGLLAQPSLAAQVLQTIRFAVWQHGATADQLQLARPNWTVEDLVPSLGTVIPGTGSRLEDNLAV